MTAVLLAAAALRLFGLFDTPQGILYDEAYNAVDAPSVLADPTPFLHANFGREAGFIFLQALALEMLGYSAFSMRFPAAALGILTVAVAYPLFTRLFGRLVGVLSAAWLSWSLWHVIFSRTGLRSVSLPLFVALTLYCYARALSCLSGNGISKDDPSIVRSVWLWFAAAGALLGLSQYTYTAARFLPLAVLLAMALYALCNPDYRRPLAGGLSVSTATCLLAASPLIAYFLEHPADFFERARQVSVLTADHARPLADALLDSTAKTIGIFGLQGDLNWDRNISGLPALDPLSFALFLLGLGVAVGRWREFPVLLSLCWLTVMLVPHAATAASIPNYLRAIGVLPVIFAFPALGLEWGVRRLRGSTRYTPHAVVAGAVLGTLAGVIATAFGYFLIWTRQPAVQQSFNASLAVEIAVGYEVLAADPRAKVYVSVPRAGEGVEPVSDFLMKARKHALSSRGLEAGELKRFVGSESLVLPPAGEKAVYVVPPSTDWSDSLAKRHLPDAVVSTTLDGVRVVATETRQLTIERSFAAYWQDVAEVVGYSLPRDVFAGDAIELVLYWKVRRPVALNATMFAHLVDVAREAHSKVDRDVSLLAERTPRELVAQLFRVPVPRLTPTGAYWLNVGLYTRPALWPVVVVDPQGREAGNSFLVGPLKVTGSFSRIQTEPPEILFDFGGQIGLSHFHASALAVRPGGTLSVRVQWLASRTPAADYTMFLQLLDDKQRVLGQVDIPPQRGAYPTSLWDAGEIVDDELELIVPESAPDGQATLIVGFYDPAANRLPVAGKDGRPLGDFASLGLITVAR